MIWYTHTVKATLYVNVTSEHADGFDFNWDVLSATESLLDDWITDARFETLDIVKTVEHTLDD
jgi:hypothetical protein